MTRQLSRFFFALLIRSIIGSIFFLSPAFLAAQAAGYWQQEVNYRIDVLLDDRNHRLEGTIEMMYINHSPDPLDSIYLHLWANAFRDPATAFGRQADRQGDSRFYFAAPSEYGGYSGLSFRVDGREVEVRPYDAHPDVVLLMLPKSLAPGDSLSIRTPFILQIPASFSRLGHVGESYQLTQWYPKPAVYDRYGWHPMPYLDQGEFYSEFGRFDVRITLPDNYVVGATGVLETESERDFLAQKKQETDAYLPGGVAPYYGDEPFPPSSQRLKTIRYTADRVHDFAWFADKRFRVRQNRVTLPSGRTVDTWALFTRYEEHLWQDAISYVDRSVLFYSGLIGEYPYPQATAVQSALSAGAGMEYPMITVIGPAATPALLDEVITHEVGHNWFYGVLASNERDHPWMDEGINTYYEQRYMRRYYGQTGYQDYLPRWLRGRSAMSLEELGYLFQARRHRDQAPDTPSGDLSELNYLLGAYQKPAQAFGYLEAYLGAATFDRLLQGFFEDWKFRHPYPDDLRQYLERESGRKLDWLFGDFLGSNRPMDYALTAVSTIGDQSRVTVRNVGEVAAPFTLSGIRNDSIASVQWYEGFHGQQTLTLAGSEYDAVVLDAARLAPELYRQNNRIRRRGLLPRIEALDIRLLPALEDDARTQLFLLPAVAWNSYDQAMVGAVLYNTTAPFRRLEFALAPLVGLRGGERSGAGHLIWHFYGKSSRRPSVSIGLTARSFQYRENDRFDYRLRYARLQPFVEVALGVDPASPFTHRLRWRSLWINEERAQFPGGEFSGTAWEDTFIHELSYAGENQRGINPFRYRIALEQQRYAEPAGSRQHYLRLAVEGVYKLSYQEKKSIDVRLFAGGFLRNTRRAGGRLFPGALNLIAQGYNDYRYDELYVGRQEMQGFWSQQVSLREGAFKIPLGGAYSLGRSNSLILALNLKADLPKGLPSILPVKPYFDIGYFDNALPTGRDDAFVDQLLWSGGLALDFADGLFGVYFPVVQSKNLQDRLLERGNYWTRVSFSIDFARLNPWEVVKTVRW